MKIKYEFVTGEIIEIEVPETMGEVSIAIDREIYNSDHRETRRHNSLEDLQEHGVQLVDPRVDISAVVEVAVTQEDIHSALDHLLPQQRDLVNKVYFRERSVAQIARDEGVGESAIRDRLSRIYKKLKNFID